MYYVSTKGKAPKVRASEAILQGLAVDGGLYVPEQFPYTSLQNLGTTSSFVELAYELLYPWFENDILQPYLDQLCAEAFTFPVPLHWHDQKDSVLELFHGPTAAFKDFGARFLAAAMERLLDLQGKTLTILVATSGDTGGAVASAFYRRKHISVKILFPRNRVSQRQQQQLTCWDDNVQAYSVDGTFDDCQRMVKAAFMDKTLADKHALSSANSINLGRLLPQMIYAWKAAIEVLVQTGREPTMIIPSGNVGNSCGTYWAKASGAPIGNIKLAVNANRTIVDYLDKGTYEKRSSIDTLANAMDVGDPSNIERLFHLFPDYDAFKHAVSAVSISDEEIKATIKRVWEQYRYILCPHTATGERLRELFPSDEPSVVYATAHPAKFDSIVEPIIGSSVAIPPQLGDLLEKTTSVVEVPPDYRVIFS
ncbi:MAG: threonine synthase [Sphaerochaetaceae bacterium]